MTGIPYGIVPDGRDGNRWLVVSAPNTAPRRVGCIQQFDAEFLAWAYHPELVEAPVPTVHTDVESAANAICDAVEVVLPPRPRVTTARQWYDLIEARPYEMRLG